ncbi:MAG: DUF3224 domain-containing protein [Streptosporangiales bacterium]
MTYTQQAKSRFTVASWTEDVYADIDGEGTTAGTAYYPKRGLSVARVSYAYRGEMEGTSTLTYLIAYKADAAPVLALERFEGSIGGHDGSCVLRHVGSQDAGSVTAHLEVVPGLGTGGLAGLRGEGDLRIAGHSEDGYELVLSYDLD